MQMSTFPRFLVTSFHVMIFPFNGDCVSDLYCNLGQFYMLLVRYLNSVNFLYSYSYVMIFPFNGDCVSDVYCDLGKCYMFLVRYRN